MLVVQCKDWRKQLTSITGRTQSCGCPNMMTINGDCVTAVDLTKVIMVNSNNKEKTDGLTSHDLQWQEERRKRKVRKLDFEVR